VDKYVDDIACMFGISRSLLNIVGVRRLFGVLLLTDQTAAAKGLVAGNFILRQAGGSVIKGAAEKEVGAIESASTRTNVTDRVHLSRSCNQPIRSTSLLSAASLS
jgi:meiotic recombination protein SPO11